MGLVVGIVLVLFVALLKVITDNTIKDISELEEIAEATFFGYIEDTKK